MPTLYPLPHILVTTTLFSVCYQLFNIHIKEGTCNMCLPCLVYLNVESLIWSILQQIIKFMVKYCLMCEYNTFILWIHEGTPWLILYLGYFRYCCNKLMSASVFLILISLPLDIYPAVAWQENIIDTFLVFGVTSILVCIMAVLICIPNNSMCYFPFPP